MTAPPDGLRITVRPMTGHDVDAVSAVRISGWRHAYAGLMPQAYLDGLDAADNAARHRARLADPSYAATDLVAEDGAGSIVGWACFGPAPEAGEAAKAGDGGELPSVEGELYALYARPDLIGTGIGRTLMAEVLRRTASWSGLRLWVVEGNALARRFYARAGFAPDGAVTSADVGGVPVPEVRYHRLAGEEPGASARI